MELEILLLIGAGAIGGFVGGLVGVGGGLIFAPILFFYFQNIGIPPDALAPLTIGSSLSCTLVVALSATRSQLKKKAVERRIASLVGMTSAIAALLMTFYVTTRIWYNPTVFKVVFAILLIMVAIRMFFQSVRGHSAADGALTLPEADVRSRGIASYLATGTAAGIVSTAAGVGGGIVMVPMYRRLFGMSMIRSVGTSSATIVLVSLFAVLGYVLTGWGKELTAYSIGYVDVGRALLLSVPAAITARFGVHAAHRFNKRTLERSFAVVAVIVAIRLITTVFGAG